MGTGIYGGWKVIDERSWTSSLAAELGEIAQAAVAGYSDNRPVTTALVESRLVNAETGQLPTCMTARTPGGSLVGWVAVRHPERDEQYGRLWGPVVTDSVRGRGLGCSKQ
jgi:hypothetical protein